MKRALSAAAAQLQHLESRSFDFYSIPRLQEHAGSFTLLSTILQLQQLHLSGLHMSV